MVATVELPPRNPPRTVTEITDVSYDRTTIALHWTTAALVVVMWIIGQTADWIPDGPINTSYWSIHVVLGFALAAVLPWRMVWRHTGGRRLPAADTGILQVFARVTHCLLYGFLITVVALGIVNAFVRGYNLFDLVSLPRLGDRAWRRPITQWHGLAANILLGLAIFHAVAALLHHYFWPVFGSKRHHAKAAEKADKSYHAAWPNHIPYPPCEPNTPSWLVNCARSKSALNSFGRTVTISLIPY
jgi:cytochrome b561